MTSTSFAPASPNRLWVVSNRHSQFFSPDVIFSSREDAEAEAQRLSKFSEEGAACWVDTLEDRLFDIRENSLTVRR